MKLSNRLKCIADFVNRNSIVADIGTDHAYIPVYLVENKISTKIIACDVNIGPLNIATDYVERKGLLSNITLRLGNGLKVLNVNEVDTVIIAGMGGKLISSILNESSEVASSIREFILQPMTASESLREYLYNNNYKIIDEKLICEDNRIYEIIYAQRGNDYISDNIYFEVGKKLIENKDPLLKEFLDNKLKKYEAILENLENNNSLRGQLKYKTTKERYEKLKEVKVLYESKRNH